jgi:putative RecB family exonuclease
VSQPEVGKVPEYLSPSSIGSFRQCPLKFKLSRIDRIAEPPTQETLMGNFVHEVLENLYVFEPSERTPALAKQIATSTWASGEWADKVQPYLKTLSMNQFRWNSWWCIENIFTIENPQSFTPNGIEYELNGKIGEVQMRGFIDRWTLENDTIVVSDYKTGKTPSPRYMGDKFFQLTIYSLLLGQIVTDKPFKLELLYLKDAVKRTHVPTTSDFVEAEITIKTVKKEIEISYANGNWEAIPSRLCDWCSYKRTVCTYWNKKNE